jgi:hypothetical protein
MKDLVEQKGGGEWGAGKETEEGNEEEERK